MLVYSSGSLRILGYTDSNFQEDIESSKIAFEENLANPLLSPFLNVFLRSK